MRFAATERGRSGAPAAVMGTETVAGLVVSPAGLAVSVTVFPFVTVQASQLAGLAGQLTGPRRPSPLFETVIAPMVNARRPSPFTF